MILSCQQREALRIPQPVPAETAVIGQVYKEGVTLLFPDGTESRKRYRTAGAFSFAPGIRVKVKKISGTYLVEYPL